MALYTIGEVALLCDINPVTLRAWQRRYGLLKPQRTDGGHRLFNDADIDRIREIKRWINNGVQVSKVKMLLSNESIVSDFGSKSVARIIPHKRSTPICSFRYADVCNANSRSCRRYWGSLTAY